MWKLKGCPRCGGDVFMSQDDRDWYMECLQCAYIGYQRAAVARAVEEPVSERRRPALAGAGRSALRSEL